MNRLMRQAFDLEQTRGRTSLIRINRDREMILYKTKSGILFKIDTSPTESGGEAIVKTKEAARFGADHSTHTLGGGRVCLARSLRGWDLTRILFQCDSWARGYEIYKKTGSFPDSPKKVFSRKRFSKRNRFMSMVQRVF